MKSNFKIVLEKSQDTQNIEFVGTLRQAQRVFNALNYALVNSEYKQMSLKVVGRMSETPLSSVRVGRGRNGV